MSYVRKKKNKQGYTYYELVKGVREGGKVRQKVLEYLGGETTAREFCREKEDVDFPGPPEKPVDQKIEEKKEKLDSLRPIPVEKEEELWREIEITWIYNSNAIEGSTLTEEETREYLTRGITAKEKPIKDHRAADNHLLAIRFARKFSEREEPITEDVVKRIHTLLMEGILEPEYTGEYRDMEVGIHGHPEVKLAEPQEIRPKMKRFVQYVQNNPENLSPPEFASKVHMKFVTIHPFKDGNGRTARTLVNITLLRNGYPPIIPKMGERPQYMKYVRKHQQESKELFFDTYIKKHVERALDRWIRKAKE